MTNLVAKTYTLAWYSNLFRLFSRAKDYIKTGFVPWRWFGISPQFNEYATDVEKIQAIFSNPACLKVFTLQCDLFSLAKVYVYNKKGVLQPDDEAVNRIANANPLQSQSDFLWCYMFWKMLGNAYLYIDSDLVERDNAFMYWLEPYKIDWPAIMEKEKDKLVFSQSKLKQLMDTELTYRYEDGTVFKFKLNRLGHITDLTNGVGNWFKGHSRIDALYKVISNSEVTLDSININTRYTSKFIVAGKNDKDDVAKVPMSRQEKESIEKRINGEPEKFDGWDKKLDSEKQVHAVTSMVEIKRFIDDLRTLELDKRFLSDFFLIGTMYNIPRDVLELYVSSTYENQEKARASHVSYTLEPAGEAFGAMLAKRWNYPKGWKICLSWDHLPFAQIFEKEKAAVQVQKVNMLLNLLRAGVPIEEINIYLDTEFTIDEKARQEANAGNGQKAGGRNAEKATFSANGH